MAGSNPWSVSGRRLEGKVVIITGGASGVGASSARLFHRNGATVIVADRDEEGGRRVARELGSGAGFFHCDVSSESDVIRLVDTVVSEHGRLDVMFNNAGVGDRPYGSIFDTSRSDLDRLVKGNLLGSFFGGKHAARVMMAQKKGCILFTASAAAVVTGLSTAVYTATKHGVLGIAKNMAAELGQYGIRVNCVSPFEMPAPMAGVAEGEATIMGSLGDLKAKVPKPEDVAAAALYLASDEACYVSGVNIVVDAGFSVANTTLTNAYHTLME